MKYIFFIIIFFTFATFALARPIHAEVICGTPENPVPCGDGTRAVIESSGTTSTTFTVISTRHNENNTQNQPQQPSNQVVSTQMPTIVPTTKPTTAYIYRTIIASPTPTLKLTPMPTKHHSRKNVKKEVNIFHSIKMFLSSLFAKK